MKKLASTKLSWNDIKPNVKSINSEFYELIESDKSLRPDYLELMSYNYGQCIADDKYFYYPNGEKSLSMPFSMVLKNNLEMYMEHLYRTSPWKIYMPGQVLPYTKFLKNNSLYEPSDILKISAGMRNSFLLMNKFSDKKRHEHLQKSFGFNIDAPKSFEEQFNIFHAITHNSKQEWQVKILSFPPEWELKAQNNSEFIYYLNSIANNEHMFKRNVLLYDHILNSIITEHKITTNGFAKEVLRYLFFIACGDQCGYMPTDDESYAPINFLRETYINVFKSDSIPIFMAPSKLKPFTSDITVYYSLNKNDFLFKPSQISNINKLSLEIIESFYDCCKFISDSGIAENTILSKCASNIQLELIHRWNNTPDGQEKISNILHDDYFNNIKNKYPKLELPTNSLFLSGCFGLSYLRKYNALNKN